VSFGSWVTGPLVEMSLLGADGEAIQPLVGIIDTGASVICLDRRIPVRLGLTAINLKIMVVADGSEVEATVFAGELIIPELDFQDWVELHGMAMKSETNRVLLGRSFMAPYHVTYAGPEERFYFSRSPRQMAENEY
jgi:predicted aspartyl protease